MIIFFLAFWLLSLCNKCARNTTMLNEKVFQYFARVLSFSRKIGSSPFHWDGKTRQIFLTRKFRNKTRYGFLTQVGYSIYCFIKAILLRGDVASFNFCLSFAYGITLNSFIWIPGVIYEREFAALMNYSFRFINEYQGKLRNKI